MDGVSIGDVVFPNVDVGVQPASYSRTSSVVDSLHGVSESSLTTLSYTPRVHDVPYHELDSVGNQSASNASSSENE